MNVTRRSPSPLLSLMLMLMLMPMLCGACALSAPPVDSVLARADADGAADEANARTGPGAAAALDALAQQALAASVAAPDDAALALQATALLFQAADLRLQRASLALLDSAPDADVATVTAADDRVTDPARTEILSLCTAGLEAADRALRQRPDDVGAHLHRGLHLSLIAWANGPARSLFAGYGGQLTAAIDAAVAADPEFDHGAPLRLQGRFRSKAPWPYGDAALAQTALRRCVALAPIAVNQLFLGDALWFAGDRDGARAAWQAAAAADGDESTRWSNALLQELARRRLAALNRDS
ncbi:MAG: hypothetical protein AB7O97_16675 [Planctomycetota bacterium]